MSFWATELFRVSQRVSYTLHHFSGFHRWIRCLTRLSGFSHEGGGGGGGGGGGVSIPYLLRLTHFIFHFHLTLLNSIGLRPISKPTRFCTKRSAKPVPCKHTHVMGCYRTPMQCNLCHCTQNHDQCMKTSTWTFYTIHCVCYEHSCLMHTTFYLFSLTSAYMQSC